MTTAQTRQYQNQERPAYMDIARGKGPLTDAEWEVVKNTHKMLSAYASQEEINISNDNSRDAQRAMEIMNRCSHDIANLAQRLIETLIQREKQKA